MTESRKTLSTKVQEWLHKHGYPLEMTTAKTFADAGFYPDQSVYYRDPETDTPREIDVVAGHQGEYADYFMFSVTFCIECKKSSKPWVVFVGPDKVGKSAFHRGWICSKIGQDVKDNLPLAVTHKQAFHKWERPWGTGVTTAQVGVSDSEGKQSKQRDGSNNDAPYKAMMGATKAAYAIAQEANTKKWYDNDPSVLFGAMTQPVVVFDGILFEAVLNDSGEIEVSQVDESIVLFRYPFSRNEEEGIAVRIVTLPKLKDFVERAIKVRIAITDCKDVQEAAYEKHHQLKRSLSEMHDAAKALETAPKRTLGVDHR